MPVTCSLMKEFSRARTHGVWDVIHALLWFTGIKSQPNLCRHTPVSRLISVCRRWKTCLEIQIWNIVFKEKRRRSKQRMRKISGEKQSKEDTGREHRRKTSRETKSQNPMQRKTRDTRKALLSFQINHCSLRTSTVNINKSSHTQIPSDLCHAWIILSSLEKLFSVHVYQ